MNDILDTTRWNSFSAPLARTPKTHTLENVLWSTASTKVAPLSCGAWWALWLPQDPTDTPVPPGLIRGQSPCSWPGLPQGGCFPARPWLAPLCCSLVPTDRLSVGSGHTCLCFWVTSLFDSTPGTYEDKKSWRPPLGSPDACGAALCPPHRGADGHRMQYPGLSLCKVRGPGRGTCTAPSGSRNPQLFSSRV